MKIDSLGFVAGATPTVLMTNEDTPIFNAIVQLVVPIITGILIPSLRDWIKRRKERKNEQ